MSGNGKPATSVPTGGDGKAVVMICPNLTCRRMISAPASSRGKSVRCAFCQTLLRVPKPSGSSG